MRQPIWVLIVLLAAVGASRAQEPDANNDPPPAPTATESAQDATADETAAIRERVEAYVTAYNAHDAKALAGLWADDAVYLNHNTGESVDGRKAIAEMFEEMFKAGEADKLTVTVGSIRLITPEVAIEDGSAELITADGEAAPSTYTAVHVKKDGQWYLTSVRETDLPASDEPAAGSPSELAQLAWMVGNWVDEGSDGFVRTSCDWAKNGKFLTSNFEVNIEGGVELEGTQVIGWDPVNQTIRSWLFDSEGGFGEGEWRREGDDWVVEMRSTQADGSQATATNIYSPRDDNTFSWQSRERAIDGEPQPDIEEVPVRRQ